MMGQSSINIVTYHLRRNHHLLRPSTYLSDFKDVRIKAPIFLLGFQGGGTTLVSRMIRRNRNVVSCTGNHEYWAGSGEMHTVMGPLLPQELTGTRWKVPAAEHPVYTPPRSWTYASNQLIEHYRGTARDATPELQAKLKRIIRMCLSRYAVGKDDAHFHDKSQVYTVKVGLLKELLEEHDPRFVLLLMNPFVACYKSAIGRVADMERYKNRLSLHDRLEICCQHWANSVSAALEDAGHDLHIVKFEELLEEPEANVRAICEHTGLDFDPGMIPQPHHELPIGSRFRDRWYPLKPSRPDKYLEGLKEDLGGDGIKMIDDYCGDLADKFGYEV